MGDYGISLLPIGLSLLGMGGGGVDTLSIIIGAIIGVAAISGIVCIALIIKEIVKAKKGGGSYSSDDYSSDDYSYDSEE